MFEISLASVVGEYEDTKIRYIVVGKIAGNLLYYKMWFLPLPINKRPTYFVKKGTGRLSGCFLFKGDSIPRGGMVRFYY
jgi:hypothetical protein